jgi:hypothetical protein
VKIHRDEEPIRFVFVKHLHPMGILVMVKDQDLLSDQGDGGLIEFAVQSDGAVFGHGAPGAFAEVILEIFGSGSETLHLSGKALKRTLVGGSVFALVIELIEPQIQGLVELLQGLACKA